MIRTEEPGLDPQGFPHSHHRIVCRNSDLVLIPLQLIVRGLMMRGVQRPVSIKNMENLGFLIFTQRHTDFRSP
jgi:hypothetical protein